MINNYMSKMIAATRRSERAETLPVTIITAIVSSILLLTIASIISLVFQSKADAQQNINLDTTASNIELSLRSDISTATSISAAANLRQPADRLLTPEDIILTGVNLQVPTPNGECKEIHWSLSGKTISRDLIVYKSTLEDDTLKCDEKSGVVAKRSKVLADNINMKTPFRFDNQLGRELVFIHTNPSLSDINDALETQLEAKGTDKLADSDFNKLNRMLTSDSFAIQFATPESCVMDEAKVSDADGSMVCPAPESDSISEAWTSLNIGKVSVMFELLEDSDVSKKIYIEQNSSRSNQNGTAEPNVP